LNLGGGGSDPPMIVTERGVTGRPDCCALAGRKTRSAGGTGRGITAGRGIRWRSRGPRGHLPSRGDGRGPPPDRPAPLRPRPAAAAGPVRPGTTRRAFPPPIPSPPLVCPPRFPAPLTSPPLSHPPS